MSDINVPCELLELALGHAPEIGDQIDFNIISKVIHAMVVKELHSEDETVTVEVYASNDKTYTMRLPASYLEPAKVN